ncbi:hypothetical protein AB0O64_27030 [Streptomyces sp. NPDC088341]|uniref:hypothetical protein n=1 Tax=Streptomyces sp. NPDC088341 TaxID=3154870 RepID=UPI0034293819
MTGQSRQHIFDTERLGQSRRGRLDNACLVTALGLQDGLLLGIMQLGAEDTDHPNGISGTITHNGRL